MKDAPAYLFTETKNGVISHLKYNHDDFTHAMVTVICAMIDPDVIEINIRTVSKEKNGS